jgi:hypothetical protein
MTPDDENWSDHDRENRLKTFPEDLREGRVGERWGFNKAGKLKSPASRVPKAASSAASSTRVKKRRRR